MSLEIVKNKNKIKPDSESWYLIPTKWNDFGYRDTFTLYFKDNYLGDIKVFYLGSLHNKNLFSDIYEKINREELWFIPIDSLVHTNLGFLMNAFEDEGININWYLDEQKNNKFFDIYYHQDKLDYIKENIDNSLLKKSIFREDEIQKLKSGLDLLKLKVIYDDPSQFSIIDFLNSKFFEKNIGQKMFSKSNLNLLRSIVSNLMYYDQSIFYETVTSYLRNYSNKINEITIKFLCDVFSTTDDDEIKSCIGQIISRDVRQIINDVQAIKDRLLVDTRKVRSNTLGQYTSVKNLKFLINANDMPCLRLTNANQMNDPLEGKILQRFLKLHYVNDDYIKSNEYISSATATIDSLPMWKQYGNNATGLCLLYDQSYIYSLFKEENTNIRLYRLVYFNGNNQLIVSNLGDEDDAKIDEISNFILNKLRNLKKRIQQLSKSYYRVARVAISDIAYLFKSLDYAYENEFRILMRIDKSLEDNIQIDINNDQYLLHAYTLDKQQQKIPIKYSTVILGPKSEDIDYIAPYIKLCDPGIKVKRSNIKYR